ncbi:alpha/beta hydrolase [Sporomusa carbonis]|uniref:alpha/beta hydrolase n=1 Tax=Sporomusa carbonis TaxID=3076075 RepID=UPI003C7DCD2B
MYYTDIYLNAGFNILLVDSRAHGESGGNSVTWGNYEKYDLDQWVDWVYQRFPGGMIGIHGISMGAATALMHAELNEANKRVAFYIADSSYSDFETLLALQLKQRLSLPGTVLPKILLQYANAAAYFNSRFTFHQASPIRSVRNVTTPVLYIHLEADELIPASMSQELYQATKGPRQLYMFPHAGHISAIFDDWYRYGGVVQNFVRSVEQHS